MTANWLRKIIVNMQNCPLHFLAQSATPLLACPRWSPVTGHRSGLFHGYPRIHHLPSHRREKRASDDPTCRRHRQEVPGMAGNATQLDEPPPPRYSDSMTDSITSVSTHRDVCTTVCTVFLRLIGTQGYQPVFPRLVAHWGPGYIAPLACWGRRGLLSLIKCTSLLVLQERAAVGNFSLPAPQPSSQSNSNLIDDHEWRAL